MTDALRGAVKGNCYSKEQLAKMTTEQKRNAAKDNDLKGRTCGK